MEGLRFTVTQLEKSNKILLIHVYRGKTRGNFTREVDLTCLELDSHFEFKLVCKKRI